MNQQGNGVFTDPILVFAQPDDPFAAALHRIADGVIPVWQPADLAEIGWSVTFDPRPNVRVTDRRNGQTWQSGELSGIWFQALPPLGAIDALNDRDRQYVIAEVRSSLSAIWYAAACPMIGQAAEESVSSALGSGPEARIALHRLGLPTASMHLGANHINTLRNSGALVRVTSLATNASRWLNASIIPETDANLADDVAIVVDDQTIRIVAILGSMVRTFIVLPNGDTQTTSPNADDLRLSESIRTTTQLDIAIAFCCRQDGALRLIRLSTQLPWWLADIGDTAHWFAAWMIERCSPARRLVASEHSR